MSLENFEMTGKRLGAGGFGSVFVAKLNGVRVAAKELSQSENQIYDLEREASKLKRLKHGKHIAYTHGIKSVGRSIYMVMEYSKLGDLQNYLKKNKAPVTYERKILFCRGILLGLLYCHSMKIYHGDVKCSNVILSKNLEPKLTDFGLSMTIETIENYNKLYKGSVYWTSPELFSVKDDEAVYQDFIADPYPSDVYSLGATFCEISYDGTTEFIDSEDPGADIMLGIVFPTPKDTFLNEIIDRCCRSERKERISLDECLHMMHDIVKKELPTPTIDDKWEVIQKEIEAKGYQEFPPSYVLCRPAENFVVGPSNLSLLEWLCIRDCIEAVKYMTQLHKLEEKQVEWLYKLSKFCVALSVDMHFFEKKKSTIKLKLENETPSRDDKADRNRTRNQNPHNKAGNPLRLSDLMDSNPQEFIEFLIAFFAETKADVSYDNRLLLKAVALHYNRVVQIIIDKKIELKEGIIHDAIKAKNVEAVKIFVDVDLELEQRDESNGDTPLLAAINTENTEIVRILLSSKVDIHKRNEHIQNGLEVGNQHTPLYRAALRGNRDIVALLIMSEATIDTESKEWRSLVQDLELQKDSSMVQFIVDTMKEAHARSEVKVTPLCSAIRDGRKKNARRLIDNGMNVDEHDNDGYAPLHLAVLSGDEQMVRILIGANAYIDSKTQSSKQIFRPTSSLGYYNEYTPLHIAVAKKKFDIVQYLIESGANFSEKNGLEQTAIDLAENEDREKIENIIKGCTRVTADLLRWAVQSTSLETVKALIRKRGIVGGILNTLLGIAGKHGKAETVKFLIKNKANVNSEYEGKSPLEWVIPGGYVQIIQILINAGADAHVRSENNDATLLHIAATAGHKDIVELLIDAGISIDTKDKKGHTPLLYAAINGHEETMSLLRNKGANTKLWEKAEDTDAMYKMAKQIVYKASETGKLVVLKTFVESGVEVDFENEDETTPLIAAIQSGREEVVKFLLDQGADTNKQNSKATPLIAAITRNQAEIAKMLLDTGVNVNKEDQNRRLPILEAVRMGNADILQTLIDKKANLKAKGIFFYNCKHVF